MPADLRTQISDSLQGFSSKPLREASIDLLKTLGYESDKTVKLKSSKPDAFLEFIDQNNAEVGLDPQKALVEDWVSADLLFQLTDDELSGETSLFEETDIRPGLLQSYLFFAIELNGKSAVNGSYARGKLTAIARQINRAFPMPVMVLIQHPNQGIDVLSIAVINRRANKRDQHKDVLGKVTIIRDISLIDPHRGHLDILDSFAFDNLVHPEKKPINSFDTLHAAWEEIFNVELLNKRFYKELANWYFWALPQVEFPADLEPDEEKRRATGLIRLLTRLIFCWFIKEKGLIPEKLFNKADLETILKGFDPESEDSSTYYQAILQNLFFATLNQRMGKDSNGKPYRVFATDEGFLKNKSTYDVNNLFRYEKLFAVSQEEAISLFSDIPFLNGGLFECLDRTEEDTNKKLYLDGFSRNPKKRPHVPDRLFFDSGETADLSAAYGDKKRKKEQVTGLIHILNRYKFTIVENTPIDQEIALDPELLGKVFENLLASYNEETKTTARKQTGSFYTPRPIVEYMVDESLKAHLERVVQASSLNPSKPHKQDAGATLPFFNPNTDIEKTERNLPHWNQAGVMYFVTFRLADSLPKAKLVQLQQERETWLAHHSEPLSEDDNAEYHRLFSDRVEQWLDAGAGSCCLAEPKLAEIVGNALRHFDGQRYQLDEWVVMPNHVHALLTPLADHKLDDILHSLKSFTATAINKQRNQSGQFWQHESYDHIVRSEAQLAHLRQYIQDNPEKAGVRVTQASCLNPSKPSKQDACATLRSRLDHLFSYTDEPHQFTEAEVASLITAIDEVKILDPACGSGAFPMGVLHKLVTILGKLDPDNDRWKQTQLQKLDSAPMREELERAFADNNDDYGRKLYLIENCLYGVDIQPIAIQITKLRFFISLVCDQKTNRNKKDNHGIRPLPNLETKFVAANSLIGLPEMGQDSLIDPRLNTIEKEIESLYHSHFSIQRRDQKLSVQRRIKSLRNEMATILAQSLMSPAKGKRVAKWDPFDPQQSADFFDPHWMFGTSVAEGFDVTIGNPPYVRADEQSEANIAQRQAILASEQYETLWEKWDLFVPFLERSYKLLRPGGVSTMIVSDAFCHSKYAQKAQNWYLQNARILRLDFCGEVKIFDAAVHNVITCFQKADGATWKPLRRLHREAFGEVTELPRDEQSKLTHRVFFPEDAAIQAFECKSIVLDAICYISKGMVVHADERQARGEFELKDLVSDAKDATHPKPFVEGKHLERWLPAKQKWLEWGTARAPALFSRPTFPQIYTVPEKVISVDMSAGVERLRVAYDDARLFHNHSAWSFVPWDSLEGVRNRSLKKAARYRGEKPPRPDLPKREELEATSRRFSVKYLLGVMNSNSARDFLRANRRSNIHLYPDDWKKLPIPDVSAEQQQPIIDVVDEILTLKRENLEADISELETQIDIAVAKLYGLTPEEIAIVEGREI